MPYCAAFGCNNDARYVKTVSYHRFPEDQKLLKEWLAKISRTDLTVTRESRLCSDHFEPHCYERDLKAELLGSPEKRVLKEDAIPTLFMHRPSKKPRLSSEKRIQEKAKREVSLCVNLRLAGK